MRAPHFKAAFSRRKRDPGSAQKVAADVVGYPTITASAIDGFVTTDNGNRLTVSSGAITGTDGVSNTAVLSYLGGAPTEFGFTGTS